MYLLDTSVLSDARRRIPRIVAWLAETDPSQAFISVIAIGEFEKGITLLRARDPQRSDTLENWLAEIRLQYADRIVPIDDDIASIWGRLMAQRSRPVADTLIAATALTHKLSVVTRNVADFADTGVHITNPWAI